MRLQIVDTNALVTVHCVVPRIFYRDGVRDGAIVKIADGKPVTCWEDYKALCIGKQQFELVFHFPRMKVWIDAQPQIKDFARRTADVVVEADGEGAVGYSVRAAKYVTCASLSHRVGDVCSCAVARFLTVTIVCARGHPFPHVNKHTHLPAVFMN